MKNAAIESTHIAEFSGLLVLTRWADTRAAGERIAENFRAIGADFTRVLEGGALGKYRVVGHFCAASPVQVETV